jgi:hypothetical protein
MEEWSRWACEQLGFSACRELSPVEIYQGGGFLVINFSLGLLIACAVLRRPSH